MPVHESGDLLINVSMADVDYNIDPTVSGSWTKKLSQALQGNEGRLIISYLIASGSSETLTLTKGGSSRLWWSATFTIKGSVATGDPFATAIQTSDINGAAHTPSTPTVTPGASNDDCLIIAGAAGRGYGQYSATASVGAVGTWMAQVTSATNGSQEMAISYWGQEDGSVASEQMTVWTYAGKTMFSMAIKPHPTDDLYQCTYPDSTQMDVIPWYTYQRDTTGEYTRSFGNPITADNLDGDSVFADVQPEPAYWNGIKTPMASGVQDVTVAGNWYGHSVTRSTGAEDLSSGNYFLVGSIVAQSSADALNEMTGLAIRHRDTGSDWVAYKIFDFDSVPGIDSRAEFSLQCNKSTDTSFDSNGVMTWSAWDGYDFLAKANPFAGWSCFMADIHVLDKLVFAGGGPAYPMTADTMADVGQMMRVAFVKNLGKTIQPLVPIQIGGNDRVHLDLSEATLQFPPTSTGPDDSDRVLNVHADDDKLGVTYYAANTTDVIKHRNGLVTSPTPAHWTIHASSQTEASGVEWDFTNLTVSGMTVTLADVFTFSRMTFVSCGSLDFTDCDVENSSITSVVDTNDHLDLGANGTLDNCTIDVTNLSAGNRLMSLTSGEMDNVTNCDFTGSSTAGHAMRITSSGTVTFVGNTFTGFGSTTSAAIEYSAAGTLTINVSGGGTIPTTYATGGGSVVVNQNVVITLTGLAEDTRVACYDDAFGNNGVLIEEKTTTALDPDPAFTINTATSPVVNFMIQHVDYQDASIWQYTVPATDTTVPVVQQTDRQYF